jgi:NAD(P)H-hydrate epimerase
MIDSVLLSPLPTPAEMNAWDKAASDMGLSTELLMENASREALHTLEDTLGDLRGQTVLCLAGPGNNGGDAIALARHLHDARAEVTLLLVRPAWAYTGAPGFHLRLARRTGVNIRQLGVRKPALVFEPNEDSGGEPGESSGPACIPLEVFLADLESAPSPDIVVDGLLGTGLKGDPSSEYAALIEAVNRLGESSFVLALDIPSGLSGLTGRPSSHTIRADLTVTFEAAKLGLRLPAALPHVGELEVRAIGIPRTVQEELPPTHRLLAPGLSLLLPEMDPAMHKGVAGRLLVIGGSPGLTGAPLLAAMGALRAGVGLVTVACPGGLEPTLKAGYPDVMTMPLGDGREWTAAMAREIVLRLLQFDALVIGPGIGRGADTAEFLSELANALQAGRPAEEVADGQLAPGLVADSPEGDPLPCVWDADALFWLASNPGRLASTSRSIITPHSGEAARLLGRSVDEIEADRPGAARKLADSLGVTAILKGPASLVCAGKDASKTLFVSPFITPNLAVGGSGDVLAGVLGSLLVRDLSPLLAACLGVYWHGLAGRLVSGDFPYRGNLASDIAQTLPRALTEWLDAKS